MPVHGDVTTVSWVDSVSPFRKALRIPLHTTVGRQSRTVLALRQAEIASASVNSGLDRCFSVELFNGQHYSMIREMDKQ
jgi:hypothetical protein